MDSLSHHVMLRVDRAIEILRDGGIVAFPTDTVYGLGGNVFNIEAVERIYRVKQRSKHLPLPVLLADTAQLTGIKTAIHWLIV